MAMCDVDDGFIVVSCRAVVMDSSGDAGPSCMRCPGRSRQDGDDPIMPLKQPTCRGYAARLKWFPRPFFVAGFMKQQTCRRGVARRRGLCPRITAFETAK